MDYTNYADIYNAEHADYREDVAFFVGEARKARPPVLELGCGTGRILLDVARAGVEAWGVERNLSMLEVARRELGEMPPEVRQRVTLVQGDMSNFKLDRTFGLIYLPFREFMHLMRVPQQLAALRCIRRHLHPDGRLILNHYDVDLTTLRGPQDEPPVYRQKHADFVHPATGRMVLLSSSASFDPVAQQLSEERIYETLDSTGRVADRRYLFLTQRWFFRWEMHHLLERTGFKVESLYGNYARGPYRRMGDDLIWVARPMTEKELRHGVEELQREIRRQRNCRQEDARRDSPNQGAGRDTV